MVTLRVCRGCNNAVFSLNRENNERCSLGPLVQAQCLLAFPAILVSCWKLSSRVPDAGPELAQGTEKPVAPGYCQGQFYACLLFQAGSVWERTAGFSAHVLRFSRFGVFAYPGCPLPSLQDVCCQIQMSLPFIIFWHRSSTMFWLFSLFYKWEMPHNEHGDFYSSSVLLVLDFLLLEPNCEEKASGDQAMK